MVTTHNLGNDWFIDIFEAHEDRDRAFATVRNPINGKRIDLPADSFELLHEIINRPGVLGA